MPLAHILELVLAIAFGIFGGIIAPKRDREDRYFIEDTITILLPACATGFIIELVKIFSHDRIDDTNWAPPLILPIAITAFILIVRRMGIKKLNT